MAIPVYDWVWINSVFETIHSIKSVLLLQNHRPSVNSRLNFLSKGTLLFLLLGVIYASCTKEEFITDTSADIELSRDTVTFDTVFTARGSATRSFKIYNRHDKFIRINNISIVGGTESAFRMNVDGIPGNSISDVEIPPEDSIYVFLEVTVDPDQPLSISPFVIGDQMEITTNGNQQQVVLEAWGQNANYVPNRFASGSQSLYTCQMNEWTWDDPKPYVIFGALIVDSCTLVMPAGTQVYVHGGFGRTDNGGLYNDGVLYFFTNGKLRIEGTAEDPVVIQGDRLETEFDEEPGQWGRIQFGPRSRGNSINHAVIKNAIIGVLVDSLAELTIKNSQIYNTSSSNLAGYSATITAENCLFHTSYGSNCVSLVLGGSYNFTYCTLANYFSPTEALRATNFTCLDGTPLCTDPVAARLSLNFKNSIIYGSTRDEISLVDAVGDQDPTFFRYSMENCIVRVDELLDEEGFPDFFDHCDPCLNGDNATVLFQDVDNYDFHLDSLSVAKEMATPLITIRRDLEGNDRDSQKPDVGCYECILD